MSALSCAADSLITAVETGDCVGELCSIDKYLMLKEWYPASNISFETVSALDSFIATLVMSFHHELNTFTKDSGECRVKAMATLWEGEEQEPLVDYSYIDDEGNQLGIGSTKKEYNGV